MASTSYLYHNHKIKKYKYVNTTYQSGTTIFKIEKDEHFCGKCGSRNVTLDNMNTRRIQTLPIGFRQIFLEVDVWRCNCSDCGTRQTENINFIPHKKSRISRALIKMIIDLRGKMTISAIEEKYGIDWKTIKNCEKEHLKRKSKRKRLKDVKAIGLDEIYISPKHRKYITIVRDLDSGDVLHVGEGKGVDALKQFTKRLNCSKHKIKTIAMDMSKSFQAWAKEVLPKADIVFDHFHVIKLMNKKVNSVRISTMKELDEEQKKSLTGQKYLFLTAEERLEKDRLKKLKKLRNMFKDLGEINLMKEYLRGIYRNVIDPLVAEGALIDWCEMADESSITGLHQMAKTIRNHINGIVAFWKTDGITNAAMEGFNTKVRCLIKQAYGYRDMEYFYYKIYDLPKRKIQVVI